MISSNDFYTFIKVIICFFSQFSHSVTFDSLQSHRLQNARLPCPSPTPRACSNSCPLSWWCHPTISSSVIPFSSHLQSCSASGSFQMSQFVASGGQSIGFSASVSVLPMNIQDWFPLGWTSWISLLAYISIVTAHRLFIWNLTVNKVFPSCTLTIPTIALWNISTLIYRNKI